MGRLSHVPFPFSCPERGRGVDGCGEDLNGGSLGEPPSKSSGDGDEAPGPIGTRSERRDPGRQEYVWNRNSTEPRVPTSHTGTGCRDLRMFSSPSVRSGAGVGPGPRSTGSPFPTTSRRPFTSPTGRPLCGCDDGSCPTTLGRLSPRPRVSYGGGGRTGGERVRENARDTGGIPRHSGRERSGRGRDLWDPH